MLFYPLIRYRKQVVRVNFRNSFPEKTPAEIDRLMRKFYRNMLDVTFEILKMFSSRPDWADTMITMENTETFRRYALKGRSIIVVLGHLGNWELAGTRINNLGYHQVYAIYHPLTNKLINRWFKNMRERQGMMLYSMQEAVSGMVRNRHKLIATGFIADQVPLSPRDYATTFLNQPTLVFRGPAVLSRKLNQPLFYLHISRPRRGHYVMRPELLCDDPARHDVSELTEMHLRKLEANIRQQPEIWLWTHRRWKRRPKWQGLMKDVEKNKPVSSQ